MSLALHCGVVILLGVGLPSLLVAKPGQRGGADGIGGGAVMLAGVMTLGQGYLI